MNKLLLGIGVIIVLSYLFFIIPIQSQEEVIDYHGATISPNVTLKYYPICPVCNSSENLTYLCTVENKVFSNHFPWWRKDLVQFWYCEDCHLVFAVR